MKIVTPFILSQIVNKLRPKCNSGDLNVKFLGNESTGCVWICTVRRLW
jgi:hypothetical protein